MRGPARGRGGVEPREQVDRFERDLIRDELIMAAGDVRLAAEALGTPRKTLYDKIARHGLTPTDYR